MFSFAFIAFAVVCLLSAYLTHRFVNSLLLALNKTTKTLEFEGALIDAMYNDISRFLKITNDNDHKDLRDILSCAPLVTLNSSIALRFLRNFPIDGEGRVSNKPRDAGETDIDHQFSSLDDQARELFSRAMGSVVLLATYEVPFFGAQYRRRLLARGALTRQSDADRKEGSTISEPLQVIHRFEKMNLSKMRPKLKKAAW